MSKTVKKESLRELQRVPGVGPSIAEDLWNLGIRSPGDLQIEDPDDLYQRHCAQVGGPVDRCVLYVFRCAIYFATHENHDPELLKWWNWKDGTK